MRLVVERIKSSRQEKGMSYQDLSKITGFSESFLQGYEAGEVEKIPTDKLEIIANALDVNPEWLMGFDIEINPDVDIVIPESIDEAMKLLNEIMYELSYEDLESLHDFVLYLKSKHKDESD